VVLGAALAVLLAVDVALGWSGFPLGFLAGLMVGLITSYCVWLILEVSGARSHAIGAIAE
jgi:hypothetical protein